MLIKDIKILLNDKRIWILLAGVILALALLCFIGRDKKDTVAVRLAVVDNDGSEYSELLINFFRENKDFSSYVQLDSLDEKSAEQGFEAGDYDIWLTIPENFAANLMAINNTPIHAKINASDQTKAVLFTNLLNAYSNYISSVEVSCQTLYDVMKMDGYDYDARNSENIAVSYELIFTALGKDSFFKRIESERFTGVSVVRYYIYSLIVLLLMYAGLFAGLNLLYERKRGIYDRMRTTGTGAFRFLLSKFAFYSCFYTMVILLGCILISFYGNRVPVKIALFLIAGAMVSCIIFGTLGLLFKTEGSYLVTSNTVILLLTILGGGIIPVMYLPQAIVRVARFMPNYWFMKLLLS